MTNIPYEERIKNRSNDWYYNKCIRQYHFIIKSEGANQRYKEEIARLNKIIDELEKWLWKELESHNYSSIKLKPLKSGNTIRIVSITRLMEVLDKLKELKEEGKK